MTQVKLRPPITASMLKTKLDLIDTVPARMIYPTVQKAGYVAND
jgi:hypothetical protein